MSSIIERRFGPFQQKQRCPALEELLVDLIVVAMERSEDDEASMSETGCQLLWHHVSSHLIFFVLFQFASFPHMVLSLYTKVHYAMSSRFSYRRPEVWTREQKFSEWYTNDTEIFSQIMKKKKQIMFYLVSHGWTSPRKQGNDWMKSM